MSDEPYLSVVATTRNDNHGGDLDRRTQIFIDALAAQAARHRVAVELVLVEWNPPRERPPLADVFRWPTGNLYFVSRVVTVPPEIHLRHRYSDKLPMFQMIAKNAGIRRAKGKFVLATNIDIVFSDALFEWFASGRARERVMYRSDRVDVDRNVPLGEPIQSQLEFCARNVLRVSRKGATWLVPPGSVSRTLADATVTWEQVGAMLEQEKKMADRRAVKISRRDGLAGTRSAVGRFLTGRGQQASIAQMKLDAPAPLALAKLLNLILERIILEVIRIPQSVLALARNLFGHFPLAGLFLIDIPVARAALKEYGYRPTLSRIVDQLIVARRWIPPLHYAACGDFMLMSREDWGRIRGSPELEIFSMHLDTLTMITAYRDGIEICDLAQDQVHYHIEHGGGWTPEQSIALHRRMNQLGVHSLFHGEVMRLASWLLEDAALYYSTVDWGLDKEQLPETCFSGR